MNKLGLNLNQSFLEIKIDVMVRVLSKYINEVNEEQ